MSVFQVTNLTTGRDFKVQPSETILDAIIRDGVSVSYSCRNGTCASCKAELVSGRVVYDQYSKAALTDEEAAGGAVLLCRAHPRENVQIRAPELAQLGNTVIRKLPCRVIGLSKLAHDVMELKLRLPKHITFNYVAGQYIDMMMRDGRKRGFSIANHPGSSDELTLQVRHVPKGRFTSLVFQGMKVGDIFRFEGPLGTFFLRNDSNLPIIMVAGGTGIAPLNAIIDDMLAQGIQRKTHLFWGVRAQKDLYLPDKLDYWKEAFGGSFNYTVVLSELEEGADWNGETGWVHEVILNRYPDLSRFEVYSSGPPPMVEAIRDRFPSHGLDLNNLFYDSFEFSSDTLYHTQ